MNMKYLHFMVDNDWSAADFNKEAVSPIMRIIAKLPFLLSVI